MASSTTRMAEFVAGLTFDQLSAGVVEQAKRIFMDAIGCALSGFSVEPRKAHIALRMAKAFAAKPESTVIGGGATHAAVAALSNGFLINSADNDDTHKRALIHVGSVVVPAALAVTEAEAGDGRLFILSLVAGYEIAVRVGMAVMPSHYRFWHSTGTNGTFGAAAAAAKAYGLGAKSTGAALGFAGTQAAGLNAFFESGDDTKSLHPGKAGFNGVLAALLAGMEATSSPDILGHAKGYLVAFSEAPNAEELTAGLGERWEILQNGFKPYPSILASHSAIGATLEIIAKDAIHADDIESITVETYSTVKSHFSNKDVTTTMGARLSVPYCVAAAVVDGEITQEQFKENRYRDPMIRRILERTEIVADPDLSKLYPEKFPARVLIRLKSGEHVEATCLYPKGDPNNPLSAEELESKFRQNARGVISDKVSDELLGMIRALPSVRMRELTSLLRTVRQCHV